METIDQSEIRDRLLLYALSHWSNYKIPDHVVLIASHLEALAMGRITRLIITMPPRHGKTFLSSGYFPAWYLGRNPDHQVIAASYAQDLAETSGRMVRNLIASDIHGAIFPESRLAEDSQSISKFSVGERGVYLATGVGGRIAGYGANLLAIDDPFRGRKDADSQLQRETVKNWYAADAYTRLMPDENGIQGRILVISCMTGDTPVLMADGTETPLREVKIGDSVATYDDGKLRSARVLNYRNNGRDNIYRITTTCGKIVRANERHPFLVNENGQIKWVRLKNLHTAQRIVIARGNGGNGRVKFALQTDAMSQPAAEGTAIDTTSGRSGLMDTVHRLSTRRLTASAASRADTGSPLLNTMRWWLHKMVSALSANNPLATMFAHTGAESCASTTATTQTRSDRFCATTAISPQGTQKQKLPHLLLQNTSDFTTTGIESIVPDGVEDVFDVQIERTENFIANGLVSHNTRWHHDDLVGWLLREQAHEKWTVLNLPAIKSESPNPEDWKEEDALWPEQYPVERLRLIRKTQGSRDWNALFQQKPSPDEGGIFKKHWWRKWPDGKPLPKAVHTIQSWDTAFSEKAEKANSYSARSTWAIFKDEEGRHAIMIQERWKAHVDYPTLRKEGQKAYMQWNPDRVLIEKKASGQSLIQDMRRAGLPVTAYNPDRDKIARAYAIQALFESGLVYYPDRRWAEDFIDEVAQFPVGESDDLVDTMTQALIWLRNGWWVRQPDEPKEDEDDEPVTRRAAYG